MIQNTDSSALLENNWPGLVPVHTPPGLFHRNLAEYSVEFYSISSNLATLVPYRKKKSPSCTFSEEE